MEATHALTYPGLAYIHGSRRRVKYCRLCPRWSLLSEWTGKAACTVFCFPGDGCFVAHQDSGDPTLPTTIDTDGSADGADGGGISSGAGGAADDGEGKEEKGGKEGAATDMVVVQTDAQAEGRPQNIGGKGDDTSEVLGLSFSDDGMVLLREHTLSFWERGPDGGMDGGAGGGAAGGGDAGWMGRVDPMALERALAMDDEA
jgi:hypothetical protein